MKKFLLLMIVASLSILSCSKDDEPVPDAKLEIDLTDGSFKSTTASGFQFTYEDENGNIVNGRKYRYLVYKFNKDLTCEVKQFDLDDNTEINSYNATYSFTYRHLQITFADGVKNEGKVLLVDDQVELQIESNRFRNSPN